MWQAETFGFHMVEMEFRQHSVVHERALADIRENGIHGNLQPMTREVLDTFRAIGSIQRRYGKKMATVTLFRSRKALSMLPMYTSWRSSPSPCRRCAGFGCYPPV